MGALTQHQSSVIGHITPRTFLLKTAVTPLLQVLWRKGYGKECDVWSLGIVLFIALAGYPPFDGANNDEVNIPIPAPPLCPALHSAYSASHVRT